MRQKRLLLVEDEKALWPAYGRLLKRWEIVVAGTLREGEEKLRDGSFDVVVLDLGLPDGDGRVLRERLSGTPGLLLIVVSGELMPREVPLWESEGTLVFRKGTPWHALLVALGEDPGDPERGDAPEHIALHVALDRLAAEHALTPTEHEVLRLYFEGHSNRSAAKKLKVSAGTVDRHLTWIRSKFGVESSSALMLVIAQRALRDRI